MNNFELLTKYIPCLGKDEYGEWVIDRENDGSPEHPIQLPFVNYSEMVDSFIQDVYKFEEEHHKVFNIVLPVNGVVRNLRELSGPAVDAGFNGGQVFADLSSRFVVRFTRLHSISLTLC